MIHPLADSDRELLALLRDNGSLSVRSISAHLGVTATAIKQRLDRSMAAGLVHRESQPSGRGRPRFVYGLTPVGTRALGDSQGDLAGVLWRQLLSIDDAAVKQRLIMAVAGELAGELPEQPASQPADTNGTASHEVRCRLEAVAHALRRRNMPVAVEAGAEGDLPVLRFSACPYPDLSAVGHDICDMETEMLSQLTGLPMRLAECRCHAPDGKCTYIPEPARGAIAPNCSEHNAACCGSSMPEPDNTNHLRTAPASNR